MKVVFLDTVGLLALWDRRDQWHSAAAGAFEALQRASAPLVTTDLILYETANAAARKPYRHRVSALRNALAGDGNLITATPAEVEAAWLAYDRGEAGGAGMIDHVSFQVMRRLGVSEAFSNDRHFQAAQFVTLF